MDLMWDLLRMVIAAACGFGGGLAAIALDRRRRRREVEPIRHVESVGSPQEKTADWAITWLKGNTWVLTNTGNAKAMTVDVQFEHFEVEASNVRNTMQVTGEASFSGFLRGKHPTALISWTNEANEHNGPARRAIPLQGNRRWQDW